jgi:hypothetical protein
LTSYDLENLPARLDDRTLAMVEDLASSPLPPLLPCDEDFFLKCLRSLSILPKRKDDALSGELRAGLYYRKLKGYPKDAMSFLVSEALERCEWFPSIKECLDMLGRWKRADEALVAKLAAGQIARRERLARLNETMAALERGELDGDAIAALPERFRDIAETRALIWVDPDGSYRPRPLYTPLQGNDGPVSAEELAKLQEGLRVGQ